MGCNRYCFNKEAESLSKNTLTLLCSFNIEAGCIFVMGLSKERQLFTAYAFLRSWIVQMICSAFIICLIDIEIACVGTSATDLNQPSPTCCFLQNSSNSTSINGSSISKSAGGSLKARCPFSPIPTNATSIGPVPIIEFILLISSVFLHHLR